MTNQQSLNTNHKRTIDVNFSFTGISFTGLLTILFIGLKLTGFIAWSWWWVLSPLLISNVEVLILPPLLIYGLFLLFIELLIYLLDKWKRLTSILINRGRK